MDNRKSGQVNPRPREFFVRMACARIHKQNPHKRCGICLHRIGFGIHFIANRLPVTHRGVAKWVKQIPRTLKRKSNGPFSGPRSRGTRSEKFLNPVPHLMSEFHRELSVLKRQENFWSRHPIVGRTRALRAFNNRFKNDRAFRFKFYARKRVKNAIGKGGMKPCRSISSVIGCTGEFLKQHLASQFRNGMTLENHGRVWQIDHITPLAAFDLLDPQQLSVASHWTNLQPLLVAENLKKSDTIQ